MLEYETANPGADHDGHEAYHEHGAGRSSTHYEVTGARHATDGTDEHDFAKRLRSGTRQPTMAQRQAMPSLETISTSTSCVEKPAAPLPAHMQTFDGHRSDIVNHPEDRPRAHHKRGSSQYEMASESSYRNGPSAESGSSES
ncbi:hypothetical protein G6011_06694 [Alternaria panax]|uniref:Uncharacterized protein n=1 Tax=Alternaria panax TaxID=48097 RepID=A0AAD4FJW7_9PLEO|nr:hypothetical protein G6011_06694 [Alternaria panax]